ncbi:3-oxosteroid 1-dehydrogenase [Actinoplanes lobatus]|uniref:3-oxosteroid 1-dehydrogenase n=1 Tax=Actinoplanes lobatus TaxID=113568 RepID=A0A7W7HMM7_9ACTN|nr:FAD-binding protein [Actinoplanes lobatus]MBB4753328.1 3-oxosteroid 1-dehydrogenase [Actinoplanes lobatus]GGN59659.1 3-oxosteroid 1-dehydrogenase [Actinoplanes lobatus]GIE37863.1 3-oxosteroid 1-dehydrogenase [Actinoplanes lobatus]
MTIPDSWDHTYDVVVIGSGGAGFATALGAIDEGLSVLLIEGSAKWGGSTAMSGGGMWLPNNPLMRRAGLRDSREEALTYLEATVGVTGRATSRERKEAFVDGVDDFVTTAEKHGMVFARATDYPDYYPELPGGKIGRSLEVEPLNSRIAGAWWKTSNAPAAMPVKTDDVWLLGRAWSTLGGFARGARLVLRVLGGLVRGHRLAGIGAGLATAFLRAVVIDGHAPLWLGSPLEELIVDDDGRVAGVRVTRDGRPVTVAATRGVMLAAGGFDHNTEWRRRFHGIDGAPSGNPANLGGAIELAEKAGAAVELMDDAWWGASVAATPGHVPAFIVGERSLPYSIIVDARGDRFANESESYVDLGHHMLEHDKDGTYWMIADARHARRYLRTFALDPRNNKAMREAGILAKAPTLDELAGRIGVGPDRLRATVERFNGFARCGVDGDFGRGNSAYDRYYGDPTVRPNPCLGPLEKGPFTAFKVVIGDLGTKGGVLTDPDGRALREDGTVIDGLYAAGNNSASVMGRTYPGPGSTIGPAVVFGLRAARRMARG